MNNSFINTKRAIELGNPSWTNVDNNGLLGIGADFIGNQKIRATDGHEFINMCSCSYMGLDIHPNIVNGAIEAVKKAGSLYLSTARLRIHLSMLDEVEADLSDLFQAKVVTATTCGAATSGFLPVLASGALTDNDKPVMIFDKNCHFSMNHVKPICGDETLVYTAPHNDLNFIEDMCKKHKTVAYIADGAYSMGGHTPIKELLELQNKYGLFLYVDDSHSISVLGKHGEGFVRSNMDEMTDRTVIVSSLAKAFGASGGMMMLGPKAHSKVVERFGGPMSWSQCINSAAMGGIQASAKIHRSAELAQRQQKLQENIALFDQLIPGPNSGTALPIRVVPLPDSETAVECSRFIYEKGFYTSAVFFPIVPRGEAGLRVMSRADLLPEDTKRFADVVNEATAKFANKASESVLA